MSSGPEFDLFTPQTTFGAGIAGTVAGLVFQDLGFGLIGGFLLVLGLIFSALKYHLDVAHLKARETRDKVQAQVNKALLPKPPPTLKDRPHIMVTSYINGFQNGVYRMSVELAGDESSPKLLDWNRYVRSHMAQENARTFDLAAEMLGSSLGPLMELQKQDPKAVVPVKDVTRLVHGAIEGFENAASKTRRVYEREPGTRS